MDCTPTARELDLKIRYERELVDLRDKLHQKALELAAAEVRHHISWALTIVSIVVAIAALASKYFKL